MATNPQLPALDMSTSQPIGNVPTNQGNLPPLDMSTSEPLNSGSNNDELKITDPVATLNPVTLQKGVGERGISALEGIGEGVLKTVGGIDDMVSKIPFGIGSLLTTPIGERPTATNSQAARQTVHQLAGDNNTPGSSNIYNEIGYGGETLAEFMLGDEALKGLSQSDKLGVVSKWMKIAEKSPRLIRALQTGASMAKLQGELTPDEMELVRKSPLIAKVLHILVPAARAGVVQGGQTLVRSGGNLKEAGESALEGAAATGVVGGTLGAAGEAASKLGKAGKAAGDLAETAASAPDKQAVADSIQGRLTNAEDALHKNYEDKTQDFEERLEGSVVDPKTAPIAKKATELLQQPDPADHPVVGQAKAALGEKLDKPVRELLETLSTGKLPVTDADEEAAAEINAGKPNLLDANGKPIESEDVEPEGKDAPPYDAHSIIQLRQKIRALAAQYEPGDVNARALKSLLWDASANGGAGGSAFDDTFSQLAEQSNDPDAVKEWQALRADYRNKISKYDDPVIKNLMQGKPDDAAKAFIGTKNASGLPTTGKTEFNTDNLRELIGDNGMKAFSNDVFRNMLQNSSDKNGFNPAKFIDMWKRVSEGTKGGFFNINGQGSIIPKLVSDAKTAANIQKLTRLGVLGVAGKLAEAHPVGASLVTAASLIAGHVSGEGGLDTARTLIDYVANHPKTWALFRGAGKVANSKAAEVAGKAITTGAKAAADLDNDQRVRKNTYKAVQSALGGNGDQPALIQTGTTAQ